MRDALSLILLGGAGLGCALLVVQVVALRRQLRARSPRVTAAGGEGAPPISILKPLCGLDDDLEAHLEQFARLDYPRYEVLLGVKDRRDGAYGLARAVAARHPGRVRLVLQRGEPGLNPKVNQLITLSAAARHDLLVVSDSNVAVPPGYLHEIATLLGDPTVGLVTHLIAGSGARRLGALLDNLQMSAAVAPGVAAAHRIARRTIVIGKSMALRRADLSALGGFEALRDVLAEDFALGRAMERSLGKRVALASRPVENVTRDQGVGDFLARWRRWSVIHRKAVGPVVYAGELLLNPILLCTLALCASPGALAGAGCAVGCTVRLVCDRLAVGALGAETGRRSALWASPLKDLLVGAAWAHGLVRSTIVWRGNVRRVLPGTRMAPARRTRRAFSRRAARIAS
jgi:ceramide glucosyltransferase